MGPNGTGWYSQRTPECEVPDLPSHLPSLLPFPPLPSSPFFLYDPVPSPMSGTGYRAGPLAYEKPVQTQPCRYLLRSSVLATGPWSSPKLCGSQRRQPQVSGGLSEAGNAAFYT